MSFEAIRGQEAAIRLLSDSLALERVASGYLFFGPDGVGKRTTATAFARAILCPFRRHADPCEECPSCVRSRAGSHPGLIEVARAENRTKILIEQIHDLAARLALRPMEGDATVAIIDEVERTGIEALNALLKTLEEPPPGATLILVTMNREALPETIRSRCQSVRFRPLARSVVEEILAAGGRVEEAVVPELAALAGGSPGRALRLVEMGYPESARAVRAALGGAAETGPVGTADALLQALGEGRDRRERAREALLLLMEEVRSRHLSPDLPDRDPDGASRALRPLAEALERIDLNVNPELVLRSALIRILHMHVFHTD